MATARKSQSKYGPYALCSSLHVRGSGGTPTVCAVDMAHLHSHTLLLQNSAPPQGSKLNTTVLQWDSTTHCCPNSGPWIGCWPWQSSERCLSVSVSISVPLLPLPSSPPPLPLPLNCILTFKNKCIAVSKKVSGSRG